jgi:hypothetical protein
MIGIAEGKRQKFAQLFKPSIGVAKDGNDENSTIPAIALAFILHGLIKHALQSDGPCFKGKFF